MPCYSTILNEVALKNMGAGDKLRAALIAIGAEVQWDGVRVTGFTYGIGRHTVTRDGRIEIAGGSQAQLEKTQGAIRVSYSAEIVRAQARRNGWEIKKVGVNKYHAVKRG